MTRVQVRGIYATALTAQFLEADIEVVCASSAIQARFDTEFARASPDARVLPTAADQGVELSGEPPALDTIQDAIDGGIDTLSWSGGAPRGAVFDGHVIDTLGRGAVVALGDDEGYLPFESADTRMGDTVRVQVSEPAPPWSDDRPRLDTSIETTGTLATLVRGAESAVVGTPPGADGEELAGLTELLSTPIPDGWGVRWEQPAVEASMDALDDALEGARHQASALDDAVEPSSSSEPFDGPAKSVCEPESTAWLWFGRASRFALDDSRRSVTPTMAGHHRVKAGGGAASDAVDFVEGVSGSVEDFPTGTVLKQFGPEEGDRIEIQHGKPDGRCFSLGRAEITDCAPADGTLTLRRELSGGGTYDGLGVPKADGDVAVTTVREGRWWYPTVYRSASGERKGTYINVSTPLEIFRNAVRYVDLHVDVLKHTDGTVEVVDTEELRQAVEAGSLSAELADKARDVAEQIASGIR